MVGSEHPDDDTEKVTEHLCSFLRAYIAGEKSFQGRRLPETGWPHVGILGCCSITCIQWGWGGIYLNLLLQWRYPPVGVAAWCGG